jgi:hypothetical protein
MKFLFLKEFITIFGLSFIPQKSNFFLLYLIGSWPKKLKLSRLPKIEDSIDRWSASRLWPNYIGEKGRTLGKTYGNKARCDWEHLWRTHWEPVGNKGKLKKILLFPHPPKT